MSDTATPKLDHCSGRQLKELLALAYSPAEAAPNWLFEVGDSKRLEILLTELCSLTEQSGAALLEAVCSPDTPVNVLMAVKDVAKSLAAAAKATPQRAAATLLYHLSVASALAYHERTISSRGAAERLTLYEELAAELSDEELATVFEEAVKRFRSARP